MSRRGDESLQIIPGRLVVGIEFDIPHDFLVTFQKAPGIRQKRAMYKGHADVIRLETDLTDSGTDRTTPIFVVISETLAMNNFLGGWRYRHNQASQLEHNILQPRRQVLKA